MRNGQWLATLMYEIWDNKFPDVKKKNNILIRWKGHWKNKLGHIRMLKNKDTEIGIKSLPRPKSPRIHNKSNSCT